MDEHKKKKISGITLIALVVTIIVLLILAGISISMVTGDNGILQKAGEAKEQTDAVDIKDRIQQAYHTVLIKKDEDYTKEQLMTALQKEFETDYDVDDSDDKNWILKAYGQEVIIPAGKNEKTLISQISAVNYGDKVLYTAPNGVNEWKVFYNDGSNVYIITSDFVTRDKINMSLMDNSNGIDGIKMRFDGYGWNNGICAQGVQGYYYGADFVDRLINNANWSNFANGTSAGKRISNSTATGGPTLEMWAASWNAKGYTQISYIKEKKQRDPTVETNTEDYDSYNFGTSETPNYNIDLGTQRK